MSNFIASAFISDLLQAADKEAAKTLLEVGSGGSNTTSATLKPSDYINGMFINGTAVLSESDMLNGLASIIDIQSVEFYNASLTANTNLSLDNYSPTTVVGTSIALFNTFGVYGISFGLNSGFTIQKIVMDNSPVSAIFGIGFGYYAFVNQPTSSSYVDPVTEEVIYRGNGGLDLYIAGDMEEGYVVYDLLDCAFRSIDVSKVTRVPQTLYFILSTANNYFGDPSQNVISNLKYDFEKFIKKMNELGLSNSLINLGPYGVRESVVAQDVIDLASRNCQVIWGQTFA